MVHAHPTKAVDCADNPVRRFARYINAKVKNDPLASSIKESEEEFAKGNGISLSIDDLRKMVK